MPAIPSDAADDDRHWALMRAAVECEAAAQRAALAGQLAVSEAGFGEAAARYRDSWEAAPPGSYGRLVGMLKAAILAGDGGDAAGAARYASAALGEELNRSPPAAYAAAIAALVLDDADAGIAQADAMRAGSPAFGRAAAAIEALARGDVDGYRRAVAAIVDDFEHRDAHLTGVAIADTALMLQRLAAARGMSVELASPLLPRA